MMVRRMPFTVGNWQRLTRSPFLLDAEFPVWVHLNYAVIIAGHAKLKNPRPIWLFPLHWLNLHFFGGGTVIS